MSLTPTTSRPKVKTPPLTGELRVGPAESPPRRRRRHWLAGLAGAVLTLLVLAGVVGPWLLPDPSQQDLSNVLAPPMWLAGGDPAHPLGTDHLGADQLSRAVHGIRTSLLVAVLATLVGGMVGTALGIAAGFWRGWLDEVVMRAADIQLSIPGILLVLTVVTLLRPSLGSIILVLSLHAWVLFARVARAQVLSLREQDLVTAIRCLGAGNARILLRHVLPNIAAPLLVIATFELASLIIAEASLGYLGLGVPPPTPTLGAMIADGQGVLTAGIWWPVVVPGALIALFILCVNILGDWVRDTFDPHTSTGD